ncbi:MAG: recombinase family protein, partial [Emergencia sp.]|nr:recombinase family protein [Emergencia sp.]
FALYGYMKDPNQKGHLIIDPEAAKVVKEVFEMYANGISKVNIARKLNARGIPNPTEYKRQKGLRYKGVGNENSTLWHYYTISDMLINQMYLGNMVQNRYSPISYKIHRNVPLPREEWIIVEGTHEPIIDKELWDNVQEKIRIKAKPFKNTGKVGIFAKKTKCMNCGRYMRSQKNHGNYYLQCSTRFTGGKCVGAFIAVEKLKRIVLKELQEICDEYLDKDRVESSVSLIDNRRRKLEIYQKEYQDLLNKRKKLEKNSESLFRQKLYEDIEMTEYESLFKIFREEVKSVNAMIKESEEKISKLEREMEDDNYLKDFLAKYANVTELTREYVVALIDYIEIGKKDPETKEQPVKIHWKF